MPTGRTGSDAKPTASLSQSTHSHFVDRGQYTAPGDDNQGDDHHVTNRGLGSSARPVTRPRVNAAAPANSGGAWAAALMSDRDSGGGDTKRGNVSKVGVSVGRDRCEPAAKDRAFLRGDGQVHDRYTQGGKLRQEHVTELREQAAKALADRQILRQGTCRKKTKKTLSSSWSSSYTLTLTPGRLRLAPNSKRGGTGLMLMLHEWDVFLSNKGADRLDLRWRGALGEPVAAAGVPPRAPAGSRPSDAIRDAPALSTCLPVASGGGRERRAEGGRVDETLVQLKTGSPDEASAWYTALSEQCINAQCSMVEEALLEQWQEQEDPGCDTGQLDVLDVLEDDTVETTGPLSPWRGGQILEDT